MTAPANPAEPPMAEPGKRQTGGNVGGVSAAPQAGVADWTQRSAERGEEPATGRASTGDAAGAASGLRTDRGGKSAPGSAKRHDDDEDEWRHEPVAPVDEPDPLKSLGKAVGDTVTGSGPGTPTAPKR